MCGSSEGLIVSLKTETGKRGSLGFLKEAKLTVFFIQEKTSGKVPEEHA